MRNGDFSGTGDFRTIYDPDTIKLLPDGTYTSTPFDNNVIPKARFKQPFLDLLDYYPEPNVAGAVVGKSDCNFTRNAPSPTDYDQFTTRIDFAENTNSQWFGRLSWGDENVTSGSTLGFNDSGVATKVWQIMLSNTRTLTPHHRQRVAPGRESFRQRPVDLAIQRREGYLRILGDSRPQYAGSGGLGLAFQSASVALPAIFRAGVKAPKVPSSIATAPIKFSTT